MRNILLDDIIEGHKDEFPEECSCEATSREKEEDQERWHGTGQG